MLIGDKEIFKFNNADWSMPLLFTSNSIFIPFFYNLFKNKTIKYVYGTPKCKWAGGRQSNIASKNLSFIEKIIYSLKAYDVIPSFTFNNAHLTKDSLNDEFCNKLLRIISESGSEAIIASDLLYEHIRNKYPDIKLCASVIQSTYQTVKDIDETEHINKLIDKYDRVVIRPEYAIYKDGNFKDIRDISKIEILVNQGCAMNCYASNQDYKLIELFDQGLISEEEISKLYHNLCPRDNGIIKEINNLSYELINKCIKAGVTKLKLNGRHLDTDNLIIELSNYFFNENMNEKELKNILYDYMLSALKNNPDLQLYSLLCKKLN